MSYFQVVKIVIYRSGTWKLIILHMIFDITSGFNSLKLSSDCVYDRNPTICQWFTNPGRPSKEIGLSCDVV